MTNHKDRSSRNEIKNIIILLASGVIGGFLLALGTLYYYGPTGGTHLARNVILSPEMLNPLSYPEKENQFIFDRIELHYYDSIKNQAQQKNISPELYSKIYNLFLEDRSLSDVGPEITQQFNDPHLLRLIIYVKPKGIEASQQASQIFQEINVVFNGNYYRCELRQDKKNANSFVYFSHPNIYQQIMDIVTSPS